MKVAVLMFLVVASTAHAQRAPRRQGGRDVQIQGCDYWEQRMREADACRAKNQASARKTAAASSVSWTYRKAAKLCAAAIPKYQAELDKCRAKQKQQLGSMAAEAGPDATQQLDEALSQLAQQGSSLTDTAIANLQNALRALRAYRGASGKIPGLPEAEWTDDSLADLGDSWCPDEWSCANWIQVRDENGKVLYEGVPWDAKSPKIDPTAFCRQKASAYFQEVTARCTLAGNQAERRAEQLRREGKTPGPELSRVYAEAQCRNYNRGRRDLWEGCCRSSAWVSTDASGRHHLEIGGCYW